ncbi:GTPase IMAP family member 4-like [Mytilus trossulus]|uniref:GTPase IMAP family member 4-like n=1 Tax=Mytilus trossulus TaxID=6551 RepID=UPI0030073D73
MASSKEIRSAQEAYMKHMRISKDDIRIVLIGKSGSGKSETANNILREKRFKTDMMAESVTQLCQSQTTVISGKKVTVVDTPGLFDPNAKIKDTQTEIARFIQMTLPGPHVIVLVTAIGRISQEDKSTLKKFKDQFGSGIENHIIFLFTHRENLKRTEKTFCEFVSSTTKSFPILSKYGDRCVAFENSSDGDGGDSQVQELMHVISRVTKANSGQCYTNQMYIARLDEIEDERQRKEREENEKLARERAELRKKERETEENRRKAVKKKEKREKSKFNKRMHAIEEEKRLEMQKKANLDAEAELYRVRQQLERDRQKMDAENQRRIEELKRQDDENRHRKQKENDRKESENMNQGLEITENRPGHEVGKRLEKREETNREQMKLASENLHVMVEQLEYVVVCGIEVMNLTNYTFTDPKITLEKGMTLMSPKTIEPMSSGCMITHKFPYSANGTGGVVSWKIPDPAGYGRLNIMWSVPFMFDNHLRPNKVVVKVAHRHLLFQNMFSFNTMSQGTSDCGNEKFQISASIGLGIKEVIKVTITPLAICKRN